MASKKCLICSNPFSGRTDAKTCSARCRKRLQKVRLSLSGVTAKAMLVLLIGLFGVATIVLNGPQKANAATNSNLNFQARLLSSTGAVVADGTYNIEFKIYDTISSGASAQGVCSLNSSTDDCWWLETRTGANKVRVVNGYFNVNLGSVTAFGASIPWDQTLYFTMNIGGTGSPSFDGEMTSSGNRMQLTGVPYAFRADTLAKTSSGNTGTLSFNTVANSPAITLPDASGTVCLQAASACGFLTGSGAGIQLQATTPGSQQTGNFNISGTGIAATALLSPSLDTVSAGTLSLGTGTATGVTIGSTSSTNTTTIRGGVNGANETISLQTATSGVIGIGTNNNSATISIGNTALSAGTQTINVGNTNTSGGTTNVTIGTGASATAGSVTVQSKGTLALGNAISPTINIQGSSGGAINIGDNAVNKTITIGATSTTNNTTTIHVGDTTSTGGAQTVTIGGTGANNGSNTSTTVKAQAGQTYFGLANAGATLQTFTNSTTAFQVQNASSGNLLTVDSLNSVITLNSNNSAEPQVWKCQGVDSSTCGITPTSTTRLPADRLSPNGFAANGFLYTIGGNNGGTENSTAYYAKQNADGSVGSWSTGNALPEARGGSSYATNGNYVYIIGGQNASNVIRNTVFFARLNADGSFGSWKCQGADSTVCGTAPINGNTPSAGLDDPYSFIANGYLYEVGGTTGTVQTTVSYARLNADGTTGTFSTTTALPAARYGMPAAGVVANGYIYITGGIDSSGSAQAQVFFAKLNADGTIGAWTCQGANSTVCGQTPAGSNNNALPLERRYASSVARNGYLYVIGGRDGGSNIGTTAYYARLNSDGSTGVFSTATNGLPQVRWQSGIAAANGFIYMIGGDNTTGSSSVDTIMYTSLSRISIAGALDLVGTSGQDLLGNGSQAGALTAGNTDILGALSARGAANFLDQVSVSKELTVGGSALFQNSANSTTALQIQNSSASNLFVADSTNARIGVDVTYTAMSAPASLAGTTPSGGSLTAGTYRYEVTAVDSAGGETPVSNELTCTTGQTTCTTTPVVAGNLTVSLTWTAVTGASGYRIYRTAAAGASGSEKYRATVNTNSYSDTCAASCLTSLSVPLSSTIAYTSTNNFSNQLQVGVGGNGSPTGQLYVSGTLPTYVGATDILSSGGVSGDNAIAVQGRYAYTLDGVNGQLQVIDINNPARPVVISNTAIASNTIAISVHGKYAYILTSPANSGTLYIYDISNASAPVIQGSANTGSIRTPLGLYVQGRYAYIYGGTTVANTTTLAIYDVYNPAAPLMVGMINGGMTAGAGSKRSIFVQGNYAYIASWNDSKLYIFDITNPAAPTLKGSTTTNLSSPYAVYVQGRYAYVANNGNTTIAIYDISNPSSPTNVSILNNANLGGLTDIVIQGRYAYMASIVSPRKIQVVDVSNPSNPIYVGQNSDSYMNTTGGSLFSIAVQGRYAYASLDDNNGRFFVYDLGGTYTQQLEAGGASVGTLNVDSNGQVAGDFSIQGGLSVGSSLQIAGNVATAGGSFALGSAIFGTSGTGINILGAPGAPTITNVGTAGATTYSYKVTAVNTYGGETAASAVGTTTTGNAALGTTNYNRASWTAVTNAVGYKIYRTAGGATQGLIGTINTATNNTNICGGTYPCFDDKGQLPANTAVTAPSIDTTGQLTVQGSALFVNKTDSTSAVQIQNATGATTLFNADTSGLIITISGNTTTFASLTLTNAHFKSTQTTAPTIGTPTNCGGGTGPSAAVTSGSSDAAGSFTITAGSTGSPTTCDTVITFNKTYGAAPKSIHLQSTTAVGSATGAKSVQVSASSATTFTVKITANPANSEINGFYYWAVE